MKNNKDLYDFSEYPKTHFLYDETNKKRVGVMKDETKSYPIQEFIGIRPKMYSIKTYVEKGMKEKSTSKGVKKCVASVDMRHEDYFKCLFGKTREEQKRKITQSLFKSIPHNVFTISQTKNSLVCYDNKCYAIDNINSLSYGHYKIKQIN